MSRLLDSSLGDIINKPNTGYPFELFTQVVGSDVEWRGDFWKRELLIKIFVDKLPRFPNLNRLGSTPISEFGQNRVDCGCRIYHPALVDLR